MESPAQYAAVGNLRTTASCVKELREFKLNKNGKCQEGRHRPFTLWTQLHVGIKSVHVKGGGVTIERLVLHLKNETEESLSEHVPAIHNVAV